MRTFFGATALAAALSFAAAAQAQFLIIGNDEKLAFKDGKPVLSLPGNDTVTIVGISDGTKPRIVANLSAGSEFDYQAPDQSRDYTGQ